MAAMSCRGLSIHSLRHLLPEADFVWSNSPKTLKPSLLLPWRKGNVWKRGGCV